MVDSQKNKSRSEVFSDIYQTNYWTQGGSVSGCGSSLRQTETLRREIRFFLDKYKIKSLIDLPCGDFNWMKHVSLDGIEYLGADIVPELISNNIANHSSENVTFRVLDIVDDEIPRADCIFIRDCFSHLPNRQVIKTLNKISRSNVKYAMVTNFPVTGTNIDIEAGDFRKINFHKSPFFLPESIEDILENHPNQRHFDKSISLFKASDLECSNVTSDTMR